VRYLSLFSGIEAATAAWHPLGWECVGVAEIEPFPCALLAQKYPNVLNLGDVTKITEEDIALLGHIDLIVFGSPCQDLSVAGKRKGFTDEDGELTRSGLFHVATDIIGWARLYCGLRWALWENVPGAFSSNQGRDFAVVVGELAGLSDVGVPRHGWGNEGCAVGDHGLIEWGTLDAQWFGVAQRRRRVFALADFGDWAGRQPILLEPHSLRGDSAPRREAEQEVAGTISARTQGGGGLGTNFECGGGLQPVRRFGPSVVSTLDASYARLQGCSGQDLNHRHSHLIAFGGNNTSGPIQAAAAVNAKGGAGRMDFDSETFILSGMVAHSLRAEGFDASEDGTGRGTQIVPVLPFDTTQITSAANGSAPNYGDPCHPLAAGAHAPAVAIQAGALRTNPATGPDGVGVQEHIAYTLEARAEVQAMQFGMQVRRLTPVECERLQGFGDNYTNVAYRGKPAADGPRYKALGNSMAVPVMRWIGKQLELVGIFQ
jgi:DNA (cytosine-5)-methyltransferase 1